MRAINHAITGALIGLIVHEPLVAAPAAVASHFMCDVIPHSGWGRSDSSAIGSSWFKYVLYIDAALCGLVVLTLALSRPQYWVLACICAFLAASPDFLSIDKFLTIRRGETYIPNRITKFAKDIQWFEHPIGFAVEAAWLIAGIILLRLFV